jgi:dolichol-phosphate mannosyltransferase
MRVGLAEAGALPGGSGPAELLQPPAFMIPQNDQQIYLSVVLPCANERDNLEPLLQELEAELRRLEQSFEVIVVDDASTDGGIEVLHWLQATRPWLRVLQHRVNCGQSASYCTGFRVARGELVLTMDCDRQHDPADIPLLLRELSAPVTAVCGVRTARHDNWVRRSSSRIANNFASWMTGDQVVDAGCTFRIMRQSALAELPAFNGLHRFLPTLLRYQGYQIVRIRIRHRNRLAGVSKYGIGNRLWRGIVDCLAMRWYRWRCFQGDRLVAGAVAAPLNGSAPPRHPAPIANGLAETLRDELKR